MTRQSAREVKTLEQCDVNYLGISVKADSLPQSLHVYIAFLIVTPAICLTGLLPVLFRLLDPQWSEKCLSGFPV